MNSDKGDRDDTLRTGLIRAIKKIPFFALTKLNSRAHIKSSTVSVEYKEVLTHTLTSVAEMLDHYEIKHSLSPKRPEGFASMYFPPAKVLATASDRVRAKKMIALRNANSIKKFGKLCEANPTFKVFLDLALKLTHKTKYPVLVV
jgi:hypothetical protein